MDKNLSAVAIVGRPNVGKSTLFNRLIKKRISIMHDEPGVTRDRVFHECEWLGKKFNLIDTGGFSKDLKINFQKEINAQVEIAINEANIIIFVISSSDGITNEDLLISKFLKKYNKQIIFVSNKSDNLKTSLYAENSFSLGFGKPIPISSIHGIGISDLLDAIISKIKKNNKSNLDSYLKLGILGKPNVGKSTLFNSLINDKRTIVSDVPGTTRDAIDTYLKFKKHDLILTDTAGLKKNKQSLNDIEWYAELRTNLTILNSDVVILILDYEQKISHIDEKIMGIIKEEYKPVIVVVNKLDKLSKENIEKIKLEIRNKFKFAPWVPINFISALNKINIGKLMDKVLELNEKRKLEIKKSVLNNFLIDIQMIKKPPRHNGTQVKLNYITYSNVNFPHFILFSNYPNWVHFSYVRFLENQIRNIFNLEGIPIKISLKGKK